MHNVKQPSEYVTAEQAAAIAGKSASWVLRHRRGGRLPAYRLGGRVYYRVEEVRLLAEPTREIVR